MKVVIFNADDFGQSAGVNRGIIQAHEQGVLTSTSMMVRWPAATAAAVYARGNTSLSVGLHLDLGEWAFRDGAWGRLYQVVDETDPIAVRQEIVRQFEGFEKLTARQPTHVDSHQHAHRNEPAHSVVLEFGQRLGIPVRSFTPEVAYFGGFYGQGDEGAAYPECISVEGLIGMLETLPEGATEMGCHPAADTDLDTMYLHERLTELATLCDPRVRETMNRLGIELRSFTDWRSDATRHD